MFRTRTHGLYRFLLGWGSGSDSMRETWNGYQISVILLLWTSSQHIALPTITSFWKRMIKSQKRFGDGSLAHFFLLLSYKRDVFIKNIGGKKSD